MNVVSYQYIRVYGTAAIVSGFFEPMEVAVVILIGKKAGLPIDAALNNVQRVISEKKAGAARRRERAMWGDGHDKKEVAELTHGINL